MRVFDGKSYRDATPEEEKKHGEDGERIEKEQSQNPSSPTLDERMSAVEAEVSDLTYILTGTEAKPNAQ